MVSSRAGFALIEAVAATLILAVALVSVIGLTARAMSVLSEGEHLENAARLADERLQMVVALGPEGYAATGAVRGRCEAPFERYGYEVTLTPGGGGEAYGARVVVSWRGGGGRERTLAIETRVAPRLGEDPDPVRRPEETTDRGAR